MILMRSAFLGHHMHVGYKTTVNRYVL